MNEIVFDPDKDGICIGEAANIAVRDAVNDKLARAQWAIETSIRNGGQANKKTQKRFEDALDTSRWLAREGRWEKKGRIKPCSEWITSGDCNNTDDV